MNDNNETLIPKEEAEKLFSDISAQIANESNKNLQNGSDELSEGIEIFLTKAQHSKKVGFEQSKGNMFEYIENMKLMRNIANEGKERPAIQPVTDLPKSQGGQGGHTDPADFKIIHVGTKAQLTQAKVHSNPNDTVKDMLNPKYMRMKFLIPSDQVDGTKEALLKAYKNEKISYYQYKSCLKRIEESGLTDHKTGVSSGGTTTEEIYSLKGRNGKVSIRKAEEFAIRLNQQQFYKELQSQTIKGAISGGISSGIIAITSNLFSLYKDEKELNQAIKDVGLATAKGTAIGAIKNTISTLLRRKTSSAIPSLKNGNVATAVSSAIVECSMAAYAYAKGEITKEELIEAVGLTVVRTTATYYFTEAIASSGISASVGVTGAAAFFLPMTIFMCMQHTIMSFLIVCNDSMLKAEEHRRIAKVYNEASQAAREYRNTVDKALTGYTQHRQLVMIEFLNMVDNNMLDDKNYVKAIISCMCFAKQLNLDIKYTNFDEFRKAMISEDDINWD